MVNNCLANDVLMNCVKNFNVPIFNLSLKAKKCRTIIELAFLKLINWLIYLFAYLLGCGMIVGIAHPKKPLFTLKLSLRCITKQSVSYKSRYVFFSFKLPWSLESMFDYCSDNSNWIVLIIQSSVWNLKPGATVLSSLPDIETTLRNTNYKTLEL